MLRQSVSIIRLIHINSSGDWVIDLNKPHRKTVLPSPSFPPESMVPAQLPDRLNLPAFHQTGASKRTTGLLNVPPFGLLLLLFPVMMHLLRDCQIPRVIQRNGRFHLLPYRSYCLEIMGTVSWLSWLFPARDRKKAIRLFTYEVHRGIIWYFMQAQPAKFSNERA